MERINDFFWIYRKDCLTFSAKLENNFEDIIRVNEKIYKTLKIDEKVHTFENMINLVTNHPILIQRPIVTIQRDNEIIKSIICRPTVLIKSIFD